MEIMAGKHVFFMLIFPFSATLCTHCGEYCMLFLLVYSFSRAKEKEKATNTPSNHRVTEQNHCAGGMRIKIGSRNSKLIFLSFPMRIQEIKRIEALIDECGCEKSGMVLSTLNKKNCDTVNQIQLDAGLLFLPHSFCHPVIHFRLSIYLPSLCRNLIGFMQRTLEIPKKTIVRHTSKLFAEKKYEQMFTNRKTEL